MAFIYGVRYVGCTAVRPLDRLRAHLAEARTDDPSRKSRWIRRLVDAGHSPHLVILDECSDEQAAEAERDWIKKFRADGAPLLNVQSGGFVRRVPSVPVASECVDSFAGRLRWARTRMGLTPRALAAATDLSPALIWQIESSAKDNVTARTLFILADVLSVAPEWLFLGRGERFEQSAATRLRSSA